MSQKILIIDDEPNIRQSFGSLLEDERLPSDCAATFAEAVALLDRTDYDLVLLDLNLPDRSGIDILKHTSQQHPAPVVLVISGQSEIGTALQAIRLGAVDYLEKPVPPEKLIASVRSCLMLAAVNRQASLLVDRMESESQIVGHSRPLRKMLKNISQVAPTDTTVLICGENGTGKELVAARLYLESQRRDKPFVKVNCPGIPETLFESELFGHKKGAFTGAVRDYPGKFAMADGGTIFLDEIGDLPLPCQAKLLRVLESGEVETLGSEEMGQVDVRVICATNRDLREAIGKGEFREDLFYRISVFVLEVPPLRRRTDDVPLLIGEFLRRFDPSGQTSLTPEGIAYLTGLDYPGNIRQLKNVIERVTILYRGCTIDIDQLSSLAGLELEPADNDSISLQEKLDRFEKHLVRKTLQECRGNISQAARILRVDRANLSKKVSGWGLKSE